MRCNAVSRMDIMHSTGFWVACSSLTSLKHAESWWRQFSAWLEANSEANILELYPTGWSGVEVDFVLSSGWLTVGMCGKLERISESWGSAHFSRCWVMGTLGMLGSKVFCFLILMGTRLRDGVMGSGCLMDVKFLGM